ncbi:MAG: helix-turn-helix transcriptional regulator [Acidimicrobiia bacterium]
MTPTSGTKASPVPDALIGPDELAAYLHVPIKTIYEWRYLGTGPPGYRVGRHVRYRLNDIDNWLETKRDRPRVP